MGSGQGRCEVIRLQSGEWEAGIGQRLQHFAGGGKWIASGIMVRWRHNVGRGRYGQQVVCL